MLARHIAAEFLSRIEKGLDLLFRNRKVRLNLDDVLDPNLSSAEITLVYKGRPCRILVEEIGRGGKGVILQCVRKRLVVQAMQFTGNDRECMAFCPALTDPKTDRPCLDLLTPDGHRRCEMGDIIIKAAGTFSIWKKPDFDREFVGVDL